MNHSRNLTLSISMKRMGYSHLCDKKRDVAKMGHPVLWLLAGAALALMAATGCKKETAPPVEVTVQAEHPERGTISEHVAVDAILAPLAQAAIEPKITAPVKKFYVQRGAKVKE